MIFQPLRDQYFSLLFSECTQICIIKNIRVFPTEAEKGTFFIVFRASACGESFPHAETGVPCADERLRMRTGVPRAEECLRIVFRMRSSGGSRNSRRGSSAQNLKPHPLFTGHAHLYVGVFVFLPRCGNDFRSLKVS